LPIAWCAFVLALPGLALAGSSGNLLYQFDFAARSGDAGVSTIAGATLGRLKCFRLERQPLCSRPLLPVILVC